MTEEDKPFKRGVASSVAMLPQGSATKKRNDHRDQTCPVFSLESHHPVVWRRLMPMILSCNDFQMSLLKLRKLHTYCCRASRRGRQRTGVMEPTKSIYSQNYSVTNRDLQCAAVSDSEHSRKLLEGAAGPRSAVLQVTPLSPVSLRPLGGTL
jgi:hypothetical protein